jgi:REP element-mobilizing transposase RayT
VRDLLPADVRVGGSLIGQLGHYNASMSEVEPVYCRDDLHVAYQLNWSLTVFAREQVPESHRWIDELRRTTEADGVRILECRQRDDNLCQFLLSTKPVVSPVAIIKSIKGRLQHALRKEIPRLWQRNYRIASVGDANCPTLQQYVARQPHHHEMAQPRVQERIEATQFHDPRVDLAAVQYSQHGQYIANLHLAFENRDRLPDIRVESLHKTRDAVIRASRKHGYRLSRIGVAGNQFHVLLGCNMNHDAMFIALSLMNNIAYVHEMKPVLEYSFYAGTFGTYDLAAIRKHL